MIEEYEGLKEEFPGLDIELDHQGYTTRGVRSSLGVPEEPDDYVFKARIAYVALFGVNITHIFSCKAFNDEGDMCEHISEVLIGKLEKL